MRVKIVADAQPVVTWLGAWRSQVQATRGAWLRHLAERVLQRVVAGHPVETGRSRAAWLKGAEQAGLMVGNGGGGLVGGAEEVGTAVADGAQQGFGELQEESERSIVRVTNAVRYVPVLEYGGRRRRGRGMVRGALIVTQRESGEMLREWIRRVGG